jgi:RNA polymerase sigma factor (sigma-70 family)
LLEEGADQTDGQLLGRFVGGRDRLALEALVCRHAPMVWGVCQRVLAHHDQAEDAFQATFLVLVRKAGSIRSPELLPNWLYRVAHQTACKARQTAAKRSAREKQVRILPEPQPVGPPAGGFGPELAEVLDEELSRLPEKYRPAVVLCDLEGRSRAEAARQLRLPEGTVASRLARGRARLARRLARRGLTVSGIFLAAWPQQAASGAVPCALLANTVAGARPLAAGEAVTAGLHSAGVWPLTEGVLHAMTAKQKAAGVVLVMAGLVLAGGMVTYHTLAEHPVQHAPPLGTENFGKEVEAIEFAKRAIVRNNRDKVHGAILPTFFELADYLPTEGTKAPLVRKSGHLVVLSKNRFFVGPAIHRTRWNDATNTTKARLDRKTGHWIVTHNEWAFCNGAVMPLDETVIVKYQPSEHSWKEVWWHHYTHRFQFHRPQFWGWLPYPGKRHKGRTVKEWADDLEDVDPDVIDRARRSVQAFGDDGLPYLIVQAQKYPPGTEQRRLIAAFIRVPAAEPWRQAAIDFLHELLKDPAQATRDGARNALKQAGLR